MTYNTDYLDRFKEKMSLSQKRVRGTKHVQVLHATDVNVNREDAGPATFKIQCTTCTCTCSSLFLSYFFDTLHEALHYITTCKFPLNFRQEIIQREGSRAWSEWR